MHILGVFAHIYIHLNKLNILEMKKLLIILTLISGSVFAQNKEIKVSDVSTTYQEYQFLTKTLATDYL